MRFSKRCRLLEPTPGTRLSSLWGGLGPPVPHTGPTPGPTEQPVLSETFAELEGFTVCWENYGNTLKLYFQGMVIFLRSVDEVL